MRSESNTNLLSPISNTLCKRSLCVTATTTGPRVPQTPNSTAAQLQEARRPPQTGQGLAPRCQPTEADGGSKVLGRVPGSIPGASGEGEREVARGGGGIREVLGGGGKAVGLWVGRRLVCGGRGGWVGDEVVWWGEGGLVLLGNGLQGGGSSGV